MTDLLIRQSIIDAAHKLISSGLNRATSGNISVRYNSGMLITPSAVECQHMNPSMIAYMELDTASDVWSGPNKPSTEWRFHRQILKYRPEINAIVHTHAPYSTILSIAHKPIPAIHYMIAAFGGSHIKVADYACYGSEELANNVLSALQNRYGCLMANHGMVVGGSDLTQAMWLAAELEELARLYYHTEAIGGTNILTNDEITEAAIGFETYGIQTGGEVS